MSDFEYWRLCDQLTLIQAALLMAGYDPSGLEHSVEGTKYEQQPEGYAACRQALIGAIRSQALSGFLHYDEDRDSNGDPYREFNILKSWVYTEGIADWLYEKGMRSGFFFPRDSSPKEYLDPQHERYASKLAAAVRAWGAAGSDASLKGTPKQKVEKWLRLHASEYGLTHPNGKPNESAIQAISRIANWKPEGGAPATPVSTTEAAMADSGNSANVVKLKRAEPGSAAAKYELDDDIPF